MLNSLKTRNNCEEEAKFIQDRISSTERSIAELCHGFAQYSRKVARVRDKGDELVKIMLTYSHNEHINKSLSVQLENFADSVSLLSSYCDLRVQNLDKKVIEGFSKYEDICKIAKDDVKQIYGAREKEINRKRQLDRIKERNPRNRQQIILAETELVKATTEVTKSIQNLEEKTNTFERQKLHDIKAILMDFTRIELGYHTKALEILTTAYKDVEAIDEDADLEELKKTLRTPVRRASSVQSLFRASNTLGSLGGLFAGGNNKKAQGIPKRSRNLSKSADNLDKSQDSDESDSEDSATVDNSENLSDIEDKPAPAIKKYRK